MNLLNSLPKPDLDSRLIWAQTRLAEFREGSISSDAAHLAWGLLVGWGQATPNDYEGAQYMMNLLNSLPKPDLDSRLIWAQTRLAEFREGSISSEAAHLAWGLLVGWGQATPNAYEGAQYIRVAAFYESEFDDP